MLDFLAVGDVMLDVRLPAAPASARQHGVISSVAGGSAVNAARTAVRLGAQAAVAGGVGDDTIGRVIELELEAAGIRPLLTRVDAASTGTAVYSRDAVVADRGANALWRPESLPAARVTLVSGYLPEATRARALQLASGLRAVDLQGVAGETAGADVVIGPHLDLDALGPRHRVACATRGAEGAEAVADGVRASAVPPRVLNGSPVGAGDAFAAAFLLALADGRPLAEALERGCAEAVA
jgi:sugar/nucleoside kinase (ribokinase family)